MLYRGYWADIARFACVGEPSKNQKELCDIAREAQEVGIDNLRPGVPVSQVYAKVMDFIKKSGYERYQMYEDAGHGIGLDIHEPPHFNYRSDVILRPGMVVTMEPTIYDIPVIKGILEGSINPAEGLFFLEDEVLITDSKPEILSPLDRSMHIVST
jgi:Xaa-Pro aminopeptidase